MSDQGQKRERLKFPFTWREMTPEEEKDVTIGFGHPMSCYPKSVVSEPGGILMPRGIVDIAEDIYNMEVREDDVWVVTYPKCGTTWTQEMVWQIRHNFDPEGGRKKLPLRFPFLEMQMFWNDEAVKVMGEISDEQAEIIDRERNTLNYAKNLKSPRCIKTHMPLPMLPPNLLDTCKVILVERSPKDCCVSYFHHETLIPIQGYTGDFANYARLFRLGRVAYGDYWYHFEHAWKNRNHPNVLLLWFEDMKKDLQSAIRRTSKHLGKHLTDLKVLQLDDHLYFDNFKKNPAVNNESLTNEETGQAFIRKGKVGDWKDHFTPEIDQEWERWIEDEKKKRQIEM